MTNHPFNPEELGPNADETEGLEKLCESLTEQRPLPAAGFRAGLRSRLVEMGAVREAQRRPAALGRWVAAYTGSGAVLLMVAALGVGGAGPLGF